MTADAGEAVALADLGWSEFFGSQIGPDDIALARCRVSAVHRTRVSAISREGPLDLSLPAHASTGDFAVGDWVLADLRTHGLQRRLTRKTLLERSGHGKIRQLAAANVDTLFIVTSCNADFNVARLERYLVFANEAGMEAVIVLTKVDTTGDAATYREQAAGLQRGLAVVAVDSRSADAALALAPWCPGGQTVALIGSSGVGKSTLANTLTGAAPALRQKTGDVREDDAKGRHTTTSRSLHAIAGGGWLVDTPGIRSLHVDDAAEGINTLFAEISELAPLCRFRDCTHTHEPGCRVQEAVTQGVLSAERVARWRKLSLESRGVAPKPGKLRR